MKVAHNTALEFSLPIDEFESVTTVTAEVMDRDETVLENLGSGIIDTAGSVATFIIPATANLVEDGSLSSPRSIAFTVETGAGSHFKFIYYTVQRLNALVPPQNSFMTMTAAHAAANALLENAGWGSATEDQRKAALEQAFYRISAIPFRIPRPQMPLHLAELILAGQRGHFDSSDHVIILRDDWRYFDIADMKQLPARFLQSLCMAQLTEAEEMLRGDTMEQKLKYGIISETIGESSVRLNTRRIITGVSADTLQHLTGYIHYDHRVAR